VWLLTLRDMEHRAMRFALVILGTTLVFTLLLLMNGLATHFRLEPTHAVDAIGADAWVVPDGVSGPFTSNATMPPAVAAKIKGVRRASAVVVARAGLIFKGRPQEVIVFGLPRGGLGLPRLVGGSSIKRAGQIVIDDSKGFHPGDRVRVGPSNFVIAGLTRDTTVLAGVPIVFMNDGEARRLLFRNQPIANAVITRGQPKSVPAGYKILSNEQVAADTLEPLKNAISSVSLIEALLWVVSAMIIGGVTYLSSMERRRDFAVLKAVGGSNRSLLTGLGAEGVLIAVAAALLASVVQIALKPTFPLKVEVSTGALLQLPLIAIAVSLVASAAGMRRVAQTDPAIAFAGPGV
jgi:putative ABC transport system permease protein